MSESLEIVNEGARKGERIRIDRAPVCIGRSSRVDVVFADDSVSGRHATLDRRDGAWSIADHDSTNGSYVDGERFRGTRAQFGVDIYNLLNNDAVTLYNNGYSPTGAWLTPTSILPARYVRFNMQVDF